MGFNDGHYRIFNFSYLSNMLDRLLKAKHWQLFTILIGGMVIMQITMFASIIGARPGDTPWGFFLLPFFILLLIAILFGWQYAIIIKLKEKLPTGIQMPHQRIKLFFVIPVVYMMILVIFMASVFTIRVVVTPGPLFALIVPVHLFSMFCIFHTMYFAAKTIKCVETKSNNSFGEFAGEFFFIWFFPIGIWFLQPRINKIVINNAGASSTILDDQFLEELDDLN
jgi:hypothetical protein